MDTVNRREFLQSAVGAGVLLAAGNTIGEAKPAAQLASQPSPEGVLIFLRDRVTGRTGDVGLLARDFKTRVGVNLEVCSLQGEIHRAHCRVHADRRELAAPRAAISKWFDWRQPGDSLVTWRTPIMPSGSIYDLCGPRTAVDAFLNHLRVSRATCGTDIELQFTSLRTSKPRRVILRGVMMAAYSYCVGNEFVCPPSVLELMMHDQEEIDENGNPVPLRDQCDRSPWKHIAENSWSQDIWAVPAGGTR